MKEKIPVIDFTQCTACCKCVDICPEKAIHRAQNDSCARCIKYCISLTIPCKPDTLHFDYENCTACGDCLTGCPEKAIQWFEIPIEKKD